LSKTQVNLKQLQKQKSKVLFLDGSIPANQKTPNKRKEMVVIGILLATNLILLCLTITFGVTIKKVCKRSMK